MNIKWPEKKECICYLKHMCNCQAKDWNAAIDECIKAAEAQGMQPISKKELSKTINEVITDVWGYYQDKDLLFEQIENAICAKFSIPSHEVPSEAKIQEVIEEHAEQTKVEIGLKHNFETGRVPFKALAKAIHTMLIGEKGK